MPMPRKEYPRGSGLHYSEINNLIDWSALEEGIQGNGARIDRYYRIIDQPKRYFRSIRTD